MKAPLKAPSGQHPDPVVVAVPVRLAPIVFPFTASVPFPFEAHGLGDVNEKDPLFPVREPDKDSGSPIMVNEHPCCVIPTVPVARPPQDVV